MRRLYHLLLIIFLPAMLFAQDVNITQMEYFFNADPGFGQGTMVEMTSGTSVSAIPSLNTSGLSAGFQNLYVRAKMHGGYWGPYETKVVYVATNNEIDNVVEVVALEYYFDEDPGFGSGTSIDVTLGTTVSVIETLITSGLESGCHNLYLRGKTIEGYWGPYETKVVYVNTDAQINSVVEIHEIEYFFDADPGFGQGETINVAQGLSVDLESSLKTDELTTGFHSLYIRGKMPTGAWGAYETRVIYVDTDASVDAVVEITGLEYFFDTDPGFGQGTSINVTQGLSVDLESSLATDGLTSGFHNLYLRGKMANGTWGAYENKVIYVNEGQDEPILIDQVEFFVDTDPGFGQGQVISFESAASVEKTLEVITSSLSIGSHKIFMRSRSENLSWGPYEIAETTIYPDVLSENFETGLPGTLTTGDITLSSGVWNATNLVLEQSVVIGDAAARLSKQNGELIAPFFSAVSNSSFYYALPAAGEQHFKVLASIDGGVFEEIGAITATSTTYQEYTYQLNQPGSTARIKIQTDATTGSDQDLLIDDFLSASLDGVDIVKLYPRNGGKNVQLDSTLVIVFNQEVIKGTGSFYIIDRADSSVVETIALSEITLVGDSAYFSPTLLEYSKSYAVTIDAGAFTKPDATLPFVGILKNSTWSFETFIPPPVISITGADNGFTFTDVDAASKTAATSNYQVTGENLTGNISLSVISDNGLGSHPGFDISLNGSTYVTSATILSTEATNKQVTVRAIVPANNGRSYSGKIIHSTNDGANVEVPVAVTERYQEATVAISSPAEASVFVPGAAVNLQWAVTNMSNESLVVAYSSDGVDFTPVQTTNSNISSYTVSTTGFPEGSYYLMVRAGNLPVPVSDTVLVTLQNATPAEASTDFFPLENANGTITFTWTDNSSSETGHRIEYSSDNTNWINYSGTLGVDAQTYTTPAVGVGLAYWWRVVAFNASSTAASVSKFAGRITPPGRALSFDGVDDYVELADPTAFNFGTGDFTAEAWFNTNNATANQSLINDYPGNVTSYFALYLDAGRLKAALSNGVADLQTAQFIQINKWYHAALVRSGDNVSLYVDGVLSATVSGMDARSVESTGPVNLGRQVGGGSQLNGQLDEVRIWNVARSESEISSKLYSTLNGNEAGLLAYYRFDQSGSANILPNRTVNNLNGTVYNGASGNTSPTWVTSQALTQIIPTLTVTSPNGGENWAVGSTQTISWFAENIASTDLIEIRLSTDGGENFSQINDGTFGTYPDNSYSWTVSGAATNQARIQVINTSTGLSDVSNSNFNIIQPAVSLTNPIAGAFWEIGTQYGIQWTSTGFANSDEISIEVSRDGGQTFELISEGIYLINYSNNTFVWTATGTASDNVFVKVTNVTKGISAINSEPISIGTVIRSLTLTSPNGGETLMQQNPWTFTWTSEGMGAFEGIQIKISVDGGSTFPYTPLNSTFGAVPQNTYTWNSGQIPTSTNAIAQITNTTRAISDQSNEPFTIIPAADVTAPAFNSQPLVSIGNQNVDITVNLNEASTVYYVGLSDGSSIPTASQIKGITSEDPFPGQLIAGSFTYGTANMAQSVSGTGAFVIGSLYDFYFTAEDAEGNLNEGFSRPNVVAIRVYTPLEKDSIVLRSIYDAMDGAKWTGIQNNWTETAITDWAEIEITDARVTAVNLAEKGLKGAMPQNANQLDQLKTLDIRNNDVSFIPNFSEVTSITVLDARDNRMDFTSIVGNLSVTGFQYVSTKGYGEILYDTIAAGTNKTLSIPYLGPNVVYEWRFGPLVPGQRFNNDVQPLTGGLTQNFTIQNINATNQGTYRFRATHPSVEGYVIEGRNQNILAKTDLFGTIRSNGTPISGGELFIYRQTPAGPFVKEDSTLVQTNGTYALIGVVLGNFIVQVKPTRTSSSTSLQTYYISAESYDQADVLVLDSRKENIDIDLLFYTPSPIVLTGANIGGFLESDFEDGPVEEGDNRISSRRKVKKAACSMRRFKIKGRGLQDDAETEIAYYIETDDEGYFNFVGVEPGRYLINIEFPGVPMNPSSDVEFFIDPDKENQVFEVNALITELGIEVTTTEILFNWKPYLKDIIMYPNPTDGVIGMDYTVYRNIQSLKAQLINSEGRFLFEQRLDYENGRHHMELDLTGYGTGVYFMILTDDAGTFRTQYKIGRK